MKLARFCTVQFETAELAAQAIAIFGNTESWLFNLSKSFENLGGSGIVNPWIFRSSCSIDGSTTTEHLCVYTVYSHRYSTYIPRTSSYFYAYTVSHFGYSLREDLTQLTP